MVGSQTSPSPLPVLVSFLVCHPVLILPFTQPTFHHRMPRSLRIPILLLIVGSLCFGLFLWGIETGIGHVPYDQTDSLGHPMGFNDRLYPEHLGIILRAIEPKDFLPATHGLQSAYFWLYLLAHAVAIHRIATVDLTRPRANLIFFAAQLLLFPTGVPGIWVLITYPIEWFRGRLDRESIIDIPFFWAMAHSAWVLVSLVAIVVLFLAQRQLAWRTLRQATGRSGPH